MKIRGRNISGRNIRWRNEKENEVSFELFELDEKRRVKEKEKVVLL